MRGSSWVVLFLLFLSRAGCGQERLSLSNDVKIVYAKYKKYAFDLSLYYSENDVDNLVKRASFLQGNINSFLKKNLDNDTKGILRLMLMSIPSNDIIKRYSRSGYTIPSIDSLENALKTLSDNRKKNGKRKSEC